MFSGLSSGLWWFGNPGLGYNVCMAPDGVDFAASAGKYHNHQAKALGMPLLSSWVLLGPGGSGLSMLRFAVCCGMRMHGKEGRSGYLIPQEQQLWEQQGMGLSHTLPSSIPARTPWAALWPHSFLHCSEANREPKSIQLNQKQKLLLFHDILIGETIWAAPSFSSFSCCLPGASSWDTLQTTAPRQGGREQSLQEVTAASCHLWG